MPFVDLSTHPRLRLSLQISIACVLLGVVGMAATQTAPLPINKASTAVLIASVSGPKWQDLTAAQRQTLRPLAATWDTLNSGHKGKWIALAQNYPNRAPAEQEKMQSRMVEWATLTPSQREQARLNFAETKKISPSARAADWETYQGLSDEEKRKLAARGKAKPTGAAVAVTPVPASKLTAVPITRHTPPQDNATAAVKPRIDPNTLLPLPPLAPVTAAPPPPVAPASPESAVSATSLSPN